MCQLASWEGETLLLTHKQKFVNRRASRRSLYMESIKGIASIFFCFIRPVLSFCVTKIRIMFHITKSLAKHLTYFHFCSVLINSTIFTPSISAISKSAFNVGCRSFRHHIETVSLYLPIFFANAR